MQLQVNRKGGIYAYAKGESKKTLKKHGQTFDADTQKMYTAEHPFIKAGWLRKPAKALETEDLQDDEGEDDEAKDATAQKQSAPKQQTAKAAGTKDAQQPWHNEGAKQ